MPIATSTFVGGLIDPATGAVTAVTVGGDPDAQVVRGAAGTLLLATLDVSLAAPAVQAWAALAADTATVQANYIVAGPLGVMLQVIEGAEAGDNLVSIVIAPATTEEDAFVASYLTYVAVFSLAISAPPPPILATPSSTAPIAQLPATDGCRGADDDWAADDQPGAARCHDDGRPDHRPLTAARHAAEQVLSTSQAADSAPTAWSGQEVDHAGPYRRGRGARPAS